MAQAGGSLKNDSEGSGGEAVTASVDLRPSPAVYRV